MRRSARFNEMQCWVDFFEESYFGGKMHREFGEEGSGDVEIKGPSGKIHQAEKSDKEKRDRKSSEKLPTGSLIVGPAAELELRFQRDGREIVRNLKPCQLIPDIVGSILRGGTIRSVVVRQIVPS